MKKYIQNGIKISVLTLLGTSILVQIGCSRSTETVAQKDTDELTVYTALEADQVKDYEAELKKVYPELKVKWVRDSTGIITAKLLAEKNNPQADVIYGLALTSLLLMDKQGMLQAYKPEGIDNLKPEFVSQKQPPVWTGMDAWESAVCVNTIELQKRNLPFPKTWKDLTNPIYKGLVVMPNPVSSGTGYLDVTAWMQIWGEKKAWDYMQELDKNIAQYPHSGSKPCKMAAQGEIPIGISFGYPAFKLKADGAPLEVVYPREGLGWEMEASAIVKGTKKQAAAEKFINWSITKAANEAYAKNFSMVAYKGIENTNINFPKNISEMLVKNDFYWAAENRDKILDEWSKKFTK